MEKIIQIERPEIQKYISKKEKVKYEEPEWMIILKEALEKKEKIAKQIIK